MQEISAKTPWKNHLGELPMHIDYFSGTMFEAVEQAAKQYPTYAALRFCEKTTDYQELLRGIERCARALRAVGVGRGDCVTIALPNCPQAVYVLYAVNLIGGVANVIHPLSAEKEIEFYLNESESAAAVTLDSLYSKFAAVSSRTKLRCLIVTALSDELSAPQTSDNVPAEAGSASEMAGVTVLRWTQFLRGGEEYSGTVRAAASEDDPAVILYTGGTTGATKGAVLTNRSCNAAGKQVIATNKATTPGYRILAVLPMFHGYGLIVCIHAPLSRGGCSILIPRFYAADCAEEILRSRCNILAGVPTMYEALMRQPCMNDADLGFLTGVYSGGDCLRPDQKKRLNGFLSAHGSPVSVREGYGTTETSSACCLTPPHESRDGSVGLPFPDTYIKIVVPGTDRELAYGEEGEILVSGPSVMQGYLHHPRETAETLRRHDDGLTWLYTGDLGKMDEDGFVYFCGRAKRMIVTSGYNVYPEQIEKVLDTCKPVQMSCVIGVPDPLKIQRIKAFIRLKPGAVPDDRTRRQILDACEKSVAKYALPAEIEFRSELPTTPVGKVAYRELEEEERKKRQECR